MNERIRELSKQAADYVNETYTGPVRSKTPGKIWEDGHVGWHTQFNQKFAELIVEECVELCETAAYAPRPALNPTPVEQYAFIIGEGNMAVNLAKQFRKHFGVEE